MPEHLPSALVGRMIYFLGVADGSLPPEHHRSSLGPEETDCSRNGFDLVVPGEQVEEGGCMNHVELLSDQASNVVGEEVTREDIGPESIAVLEQFKPKIHKAGLQFAAVDAGCRSAIVDELADVLTETTGEIEQFLATPQTVQHGLVVLRLADAEFEKVVITHAWIFEHRPGSVPLYGLHQ